MPNDIEDLFASLAADADRARLGPAAAVRRRADLRFAARSAAGLATVAVLVLGAAAGSRALVAGPDGPPPVPPVAPASAAPSTAPIPDSIPVSAFLQPADWPHGVSQGPALYPGADLGLPMCGQAIASDALVGVRNTSVLAYRDSAGADAGRAADTVTVFRADGARDFMVEFRTAFLDCAPDQGWTFRVDPALGIGDDAVLVEITGRLDPDTGDLDPDGVPTSSYMTAVRIGDTVAVLQVNGWNSRTAHRADAVTLTRAAAERVQAWR